MIKEILQNAKNIAVVGLSPDESKASNMVARYLLQNGYKIFPIYPKGDQILGQRVYLNLGQIDAPIDIVVMFRRGEYALNLIEEVILKGAKTLWLQLGITNEKAGEIALKNNINFIQNRCIKIELQRLKDGIVK